jgi:hypothetical protein
MASEKEKRTQKPQTPKHGNLDTNDWLAGMNLLAFHVILLRERHGQDR